MIEFEVKSKKQYISVNIRDSPRRIPYAGNEADGVTIGYKAKYNQQLQSIKDNYKAFDQPYNGKDNDDFVNGQVCLKDIDPDHLGSSSYITNLDGEVSQHIEYVPFGEVFIEERNNTWNTPYLFNAKEFDEETGMYYYGARYYEPRLSLWMSVDPISNYDPRNSENYLDGEHNGGVFNAYNLNPYSYCYQTPIRFVDPNGKQVDIIITNKVVGKTQIRLIGSENYQDAPKTLETNLYLMTVTDRKTKTISTYKVTRDAPVAVGTDEDWFSDNETYVANTAFEPVSKNGHYKGVPLPYPKRTDLEAFTLRNMDGTALLKTDKNRNTLGKGKKGFATDIMIHVGGTFFDIEGGENITGSLGCFGIFSGNSTTKKFVSDVVTRQRQNRDKTINITVQKRNNVDWNYVVDSSGNKTTVGL